MINENIVEIKKCSLCGSDFNIEERDLEFYSKISPVFGGIKYEIPTPKLCPECREQRRLSFVNERKLYKTLESNSGKSIISIYSEDKDFYIIEDKKWLEINASSIDIDLSDNILKQYKQLYKKALKSALKIENSENSQYNNYLNNSKNTYLSISSGNIEDSAYISASHLVKNSLDVWWSAEIENSYEIFNSANLYKTYYSQMCGDSSDLIFCKNCYSCSNCAFCYSLVGKKYCILNKQYTKEEYEQKLKELDFFNASKLKEYYDIFKNFLLRNPQRYMDSDRSENVTGDYIYDSKNCFYSFNNVEVQDAKYAYECGRIKNLFDCTQVYDGEGMILDSIMINGSYKVIFSFNISNSKYIYYSSDLLNCNNCFLCSGLKNKSYCIFNKEYKQEEYNKLVGEIIKTMEEQGSFGEFFNSSLSPFGYNETIAMDYFPLSKEEALEKGFNWSDYEAPFPKVEKIIKASMLPNSIKDIPDDILNWAIECEVSKRPFKIIKDELEFYRKHNLPVPKRHPDERHLDRMRLRNERRLYDRKCDKCGIDLKSVYSQGREEIVYCEECYNKEVY